MRAPSGAALLAAAVILVDSRPGAPKAGTTLNNTTQGFVPKSPDGGSGSGTTQ
jgi:hypothetical protein